MLSSIVTVLGLGAIAAQAAPAASAAGSAKSYTVPAVRNPNYVRNGTASLLKAYAKHHLNPTMEMPQAFKDALSLQKRQDSSTTASPSNGVEYLVAVDVGGETLNLDFDTGSADLWVFSSLQPSSQRTGHNYYTESSTFQSLSGYTWSISYGDGSSASGSVGTDTVTVGSTVVEGQAVELAESVSSEFVSDTSDGLLGLAFSSINTVSPQSQSTFFDNAAPSLNSPEFAAYLPKNRDGAYDFGFTDPTKFSGSILSTSVDSSGGFWEFSSPRYKVGSTSHSQSGFTAIADTGTTLLLMGDSVVSTYYASVKGSSFSNTDGGYVFPCTATLPSISVNIGSTNFATIAGTNINFAPAAASGQCFGGLQSVGSGTMNIYGDVFFNSNYAVFSNDGPTFGFAPLK